MGGADRDTPLHVAAQHSLDEHAHLYLSRGARVDARNGRGETALSTACGAAWRPDEHARCLRLCALLLRHGAAADARDGDARSPLHKACGQAWPGLALLLLQHGADATALDYGGASPLGRVLQTAACAPQAAPQRTVQALLNHGAPTVWPDALPKVRGGQGTSRPERCRAWVACSASHTSGYPGTPLGTREIARSYSAGLSMRVCIPNCSQAKTGLLQLVGPHFEEPGPGSLQLESLEN